MVNGGNDPLGRIGSHISRIQGSDPEKVGNMCVCSLSQKNAQGCKLGNRSHSCHRRKCLLDCFGGQLDENTTISTGYAQNLPNHWD